MMQDMTSGNLRNSDDVDRERMKQVLEMLREHPKSTAGDIAQKTGITQARIRRRLLPMLIDVGEVIAVEVKNGDRQKYLTYSAVSS